MWLEKYPLIIGISQIIQKVIALIEKYALTNFPVLIEGRTGTGKELAAREIHYHSPRAGKPFIAINCGALSDTFLRSDLFGHMKGSFTDAVKDKKGFIELASEGTLFIDELPSMSPGMQKMLLRALEENQIWPMGAERPRPIDTRFIFGSNQNILDLVKAGLFREDLFYRINALTINLPPLKERKEDIELLINHFLKKYGQVNKPASLDEEALKIMTSYDWPGNIRELENIIKLILIMCEDKTRIEAADIPEAIMKAVGNKNTADRMISPGANQKNRNALSPEKALSALKESKGRITDAAKLLNISREWLTKRLKKWGINFRDYRV